MWWLTAVKTAASSMEEAAVRERRVNTSLL
jgi:hypothetical protein